MTTATPCTLATMLRRARESAGLTQIQAAVKAGLSLDTYRRLERGTGNPTLESLLAALQAVGGKLQIK